jgi:WXG100 family type VII secretion target
MAGGITVTPTQLQEISAQMSSGAADVEATLSRLAGVVSPLRSDWVGSAQAQFEVLWDQWQKDGAGLQQALTGIAQLTQNAATSYETTEQSVASSFNQG